MPKVRVLKEDPDLRLHGVKATELRYTLQPEDRAHNFREIPNPAGHGDPWLVAKMKSAKTGKSIWMGRPRPWFEKMQEHGLLIVLPELE